MCQSQAEGGRRCAAHTRPAYRQAVEKALDPPGYSLFGVRQAREEGRAAVLAHASTPTGRVEVEAEVERIYHERRKYPDGIHTARWLLMCAYEADEENARAT